MVARLWATALRAEKIVIVELSKMKESVVCMWINAPERYDCHSLYFVVGADLILKSSRAYMQSGAS